MKTASAIIANVRHGLFLLVVAEVLLVKVQYFDLPLNLGTDVVSEHQIQQFVAVNQDVLPTRFDRHSPITIAGDQKASDKVTSPCSATLCELGGKP